MTCFQGTRSALAVHRGTEGNLFSSDTLVGRMMCCCNLDILNLELACMQDVPLKVLLHLPGFTEEESACRI